MQAKAKAGPKPLPAPTAPAKRKRTEDVAGAGESAAERGAGKRHKPGRVQAASASPASSVATLSADSVSGSGGPGSTGAASGSSISGDDAAAAVGGSGGGSSGSGPSMGEAVPPAMLCRAASKGKVELLQSFIDGGSDVDGVDSSRMTALHNAVYNLQLGTTRVLIDAGADVNAVGGRLNGTALHYIGETWSITLESGPVAADLVELLVSSGADPTVRNKAGRTAYETMVRARGEAQLCLADSAKALLQHGLPGMASVASGRGDEVDEAGGAKDKGKDKAKPKPNPKGKGKAKVKGASGRLAAGSSGAGGGEHGENEEVLVVDTDEEENEASRVAATDVDEDVQDTEECDDVKSRQKAQDLAEVRGLDVQTLRAFISKALPRAAVGEVSLNSSAALREFVREFVGR